jgi:hypothetical protein
MMIGYDIYIASKNDTDNQNLLLATVHGGLVPKFLENISN